MLFDPEDTLFESAFPGRALGGIVPVVPVGSRQAPASQSLASANYGDRERRDERSRRDRNRDEYHRQQQQYEAA